MNRFYLSCVGRMVICIMAWLPTFANAQQPSASRDHAIVESLLRIPNAKLDEFPQHRDAVRRYLASAAATPQFLRVVEQLGVADEAPRVASLLNLAPVSTQAAKWLLEHGGKGFVEQAINIADDEQASVALSALHICDANGNPLIDMAGNTVEEGRHSYQQGMAFRCNLDGSEFETLGWNFRNNWELTLDSFGTIWQSDNDDDGNRGTRINYVMELGNYGYRDEMTGATWNTDRTGIEQEIPLRHWHLNDPGVVPNLLQTIDLRHDPSPDMPGLWAQLAVQHDGQDRWYLEALGIGSDLRPNECFDAWLGVLDDEWNTPSGRDIIWRSRAAKASSYLIKIVLATENPSDQDRYFRAMDFHDPAAIASELKATLAEI